MGEGKTFDDYLKDRLTNGGDDSTWENYMRGKQPDASNRLPFAQKPTPFSGEPPRQSFTWEDWDKRNQPAVTPPASLGSGNDDAWTNYINGRQPDAQADLEARQRQFIDLLTKQQEKAKAAKPAAPIFGQYPTEAEKAKAQTPTKPAAPSAGPLKDGYVQHPNFKPPPPPVETPIADMKKRMQTLTPNVPEEIRKAMGAGSPLMDENLQAAVLATLEHAGKGIVDAYTSETTPEYLDAPIRDLPIIGTVARTGEAVLNALGATGEVIAPAPSGLAQMGLQKGFQDATNAIGTVPGLEGLKGTADRSDIFTQGGTDEAELSRLLADPFSNFDRIEEVGRTKFEAMGRENPWTQGIATLFDPLTYVGSGAKKPIQELQRARAAIEATVPLADAAKDLNPAQRILYNVLKVTPKVDAQGFATLEDLGMPMPKDSNIANRIKSLYTPSAKAAEYVKSAVDSLGALAADGVKDAGELMQMLERGKDKAAWAAFAERQPGLMSRNGQRLQSVLGGFSTSVRKSWDEGTTILDNLKQAQANPRANTATYLSSPKIKQALADMPAPMREAIEGFNSGKLTIQEASERFDKASRFWILKEFADYSASHVAKLSGIEPANILTRINQTMRKWEALAFIVGNPQAIATNAIGNFVQTGLKGVNPFERGAKVDAFINRLGMKPADLLNDAKSYSERIARETNGVTPASGAFEGQLPQWLEKFPLAKLYNQAEQGARLRAWTSGARRTLNANWKVGKWIPAPDAALTAALDAIDPNLSKTLAGMLRNALNREEVLKIGDELLNGVTINTHWDDAAKNLSATWSSATGKTVNLTGDMVDRMITPATKDALEEMVKRVASRVNKGETFDVAFDDEATALRRTLAGQAVRPATAGNPPTVPTLAEVIATIKQQGPATFLDPKVNEQIEAAIAHDLIEAMRQPIAATIAGQTGKPRAFDAGAKTLLNAYLNEQVIPALSDAKAAGNAVGRNLLAHTVLNYDNRWNVDDALNFLMPFPFWWVHMMFNVAQDFIDTPALLVAYMNLREMMDATNNDPSIPPRLRGTVSLDVPLVPDWLGGEVLTDPLATLLPYDQIFRINALKRAQYDRTTEQTEAGEAPSAESAIANMINLHTPYQVLDALLKGDHAEAEDVIARIPAARILRGGTAIAREMGAEGLPAGGVAPFKGKMDEIYIERQLGAMRAEGLITKNQLRIALLEGEQNEHYQQAKQRSGIMDYALPTFSGFTGFSGRGWTAGERKYYSTRLERDGEWRKEIARLGGNPNMPQENMQPFLDQRGAFKEGQPLQVWREQHPELDYGMIYDDATDEEQYRDYLADNIWERVNGMPALQFQMLKAELGEDFYNLFYKKDSRDLAKIPSNKLAGWAQALDVLIPNPANFNAPTPELFELTNAKPEQVKRYQAFYDEVEQQAGWEQIGALTQQYVTAKEQGEAALDGFYATPEGQALTAFWKHRDRMYLENPDLAELLQKTGAIEQDAPKSHAERLRRWMVGELWGGYNGLDPLNKRLFTAQMGSTFRDAFLNTDTRNYDSINLANMIYWGSVLGADIPNVPRGTIPEYDSSSQPNANQWQRATPEQAKRYSQFVQALQTNPQYNTQQVWGEFYHLNPDIVQMLEETGAKAKLVSQDYRDIGQQPARFLPSYVYDGKGRQRFAAPPPRVFVNYGDLFARMRRNQRHREVKHPNVLYRNDQATQ